MRNIERIGLLNIFALYCFSVSANTVLDVSRDDFYESYSNNVEISGSVLAASYVTGNINHASPENLYLYIPEYRPVIYVIITSIDGNYSADATIRLEETQTGWIRLKLPTAYQKEYIKYPSDQLVAFAFADNEDMFGNYIQEVFPSSWGAPVSSSVTLLMNSAGGNPNITFKEDSGEVITRDCRAIKAKYTRVFNHICDFGKYKIDKGTVITLSPEYNSSGKDYIIWPSNE